MVAATGWKFWIDRGGTFTDCIGIPPDGGSPRIVKVLSSDDAPVQGIRTLLNTNTPIIEGRCEVRMGTTIATNALLERQGVPCALLTNEGLEDLMCIGDQARPELFNLHIQRPTPLTPHVISTQARFGADGSRLSPLVREAIEPSLRALHHQGIRSLAVALLHSTRHPAHEKAIGALALEIGFEEIALSHEVDAQQGLLARTETTLTDAYLTPLLRRYLQRMQRALPDAELRFMQSSGHLTNSQAFRGKNAVLSGPAGGVVAVGALAKRAGFGSAVGFDMGGTSTDVTRWAGAPEMTYRTRVAGVRLRAPMMAIHTVAAGGGSICTYDGNKLRIGPQSAGAKPGPLCYGEPDARALTLTDINVWLGRLPLSRFPFPTDASRIGDALRTLGEGMQPHQLTRDDLAIGFLRVAVEQMAEAIRKITIGKGQDVRRDAMVVFGGAGGQHACAVARALGIRTILGHPWAGVFSALGIGIAGDGWTGKADAANQPLTRGSWESIHESFKELESNAHQHFGHDPTVTFRRRVDLRYRGTQTAITIDAAPDESETRLRFESAHRERFGYVRQDEVVEIVTLRLEASRQGHDFPETHPSSGNAVASIEQRVYCGGAFHDDVPVYLREDIGPGTLVEGPALILETTGSWVIAPDFQGEVLEDGTLRLEDQRAIAQPRADITTCDPIELEIFSNAFRSIAEQMGEVLGRTAMSTNIRERLDYSCAIFTASGELVANAPHIPVHLGAMGETVKAVLDAHPNIEPGDVYASNAPSMGGSHLPDITVVTPVHDAADRLVYILANRGHHADVGGITPGSMPPFSSHLHEEGVVFRASRIVRANRFCHDVVHAILNSTDHPARDPAQNVADLQAQIAANRTGQHLLHALGERRGHNALRAYMTHSLNDAAKYVRGAINAIPDGRYQFADQLDEGTILRVQIDVADDEMNIDFRGTSAELHHANLNAPKAVTMAAVIYVIRSLVSQDIPLNAGCLYPVHVHIPEGSLLAPSPQRAVAGGNVETSQRIVDVLLGALNVAAASQGTMNNLTFGNESFGYYETIAGGSGAGPDFDGAHGVQTHMTNSRITDPEILETRFPVRLLRYQRRRGSGGVGRHTGGDGLVREFLMLDDLQVSILSQRRTTSPFGLEGGSPGDPGKNTHNDKQIDAKVSLSARSGDRITIATPGGGGYGAPVAGELCPPGHVRKNFSSNASSD